jgi:hypothetical protein
MQFARDMLKTLLRFAGCYAISLSLQLPIQPQYISIIMSTDWRVIFDKTLADYVQQYIEARGDSDTRAQILKDCGENIVKSPLHDKQAIELPKDLCWVSISFY